MIKVYKGRMHKASTFARSRKMMKVSGTTKNGQTGGGSKWTYLGEVPHHKI